MTSRSGAGRLFLEEPAIEHTENLLRITILISNGGSIDLESFECSDVRLGREQLISPASFPVFVGDMPNGAIGSIVCTYSNESVRVGQQLPLIVRGSYALNGGRFGATLTRFVTIPGKTSPSFQQVTARVESNMNNLVWDYTVMNEEPLGSTQHIASISLEVAAPVTITGTPQGWRSETDGESFVYWVAEDAMLPYENHISPGNSLSGFQLTSPRVSSESSPIALGAWDHSTDEAGLVATEYVLTPHRRN